ncbi:MAG TPA: SDR family NAD(P)-dependent oxidoreductase [Solirubrobacterales bacterium]|nr:SDR family NAD(P)-dependent oxidoreductase [Solirubrobacterales bacterium]
MSDLPERPLEGRVALISGAARGLGAAVAAALVRDGARVVLGDVLEQECQETAAALAEQGASAHALRLDVTREQDWIAAVAETEQRFGQLDVLVNNAGVLRRKPIAETSLEDWSAVLDINLTGAFLGIKHAAPLLRRSPAGSIVNVGSVAGLAAHYDPTYCSSKWGLRGLTKAASLELSDDGVRVNAVHPSAMITPLVETASARHRQASRELIPLGREVLPEEVAETVAFLAGDRSAFITGADLPIDGGYVEAGVTKARERFKAAG